MGFAVEDNEMEGIEGRTVSPILIVDAQNNANNDSKPMKKLEMTQTCSL
jgi:hypothetical protein